ncbi:MAG: hypothetical protein DMF92_20605 [Acidobacteria bacterium]|nr:MAG: hypothetical protein DMF92_20605 [Acidobacteriota bacterium]
MIIPSRQRTLPIGLAAAAAIGGAIAALRYHDLGLTLSHYDARGHLVVARRILDSLTPGWQQVGAVWLPLPHLLNAVPVQIDTFYRTGASAVAISIAAFAIATGAIAWIVLRQTQSSGGALVAAAVFALNPNVVYLQATPMTEPLLLGLTTLSVALLLEWLDSDRRGAGLQTRTPAARTAGLKPRAADAPTTGLESLATSTARADAMTGWVFALACLTRYEAWPVTACALAGAVWAGWRRGNSLKAALRRVMPIAAYPAVAIVAFAIFSRVVIGEWLVASGFFVPENKSVDRPVLAAAEIWWGIHHLSGYLTLALAVAGLAWLLATGLFSRGRADRVVALSLAATAVVPWLAFVEGHPFRIRYMVPLIAIEAIGAGAAVGFFDFGFFSRGARLIRWTRPRLWSSKLSGIGRTCRCAPMSPIACVRATTGTPLWRAWDRSAITCRRRRRTGSTSAIFCTKATATSGLRLFMARGRTPAGCSSRRRRKAATCWRRSRASTRTFSTGTHASAKARGSRCTSVRIER